MAYSPYYSGGWQNTESGDTPINAAALNNMEAGIGAAVQKSGDTMTGRLTVPSLVNNSAEEIGVADYAVMPSESGPRKSTVRTQWTPQGIIRMLFYYFATNNTNYDVYRLPSFDASATDNATYDILTTKNAVTVAQGGTGGNTKQTAKQGIGIVHGTLTTPSLEAGHDAFVSVTFPTAFSGTGYSAHLELIGNDSLSLDIQAVSSLRWFIRERTTTGMKVQVVNTGNSTIGAYTLCYTAVGE